MQVSNWFINARVRLWKPMVEEMYLEEQKDGGAATADENDVVQNQNNPSRNEDQKPSHEQLVRIDSECLSSIINNNPDKNDAKKSKTTLDHHHNSYARVGESYDGAMELDFSSSYTTHHHSAGGGVSLTLGLHQLGEGGGGGVVSQSSLFYARDQMEECQPVQYSSLLESENQNLQYRNLMGAQLLHDLAG